VNSISGCAKRLSLEFPSVVEAIRSGSLKPEEFSKQVIEARQLRRENELKMAVGEDRKNSLIGASELSKNLRGKAILWDLIYLACCGDLKMSQNFAGYFIYTNYLHGLVGAISGAIVKKDEKGMVIKNPEIVAQVHCSYGYACTKMRFEIEHRAKKSLMEHCPAFTTSFDKFFAVLGVIVQENNRFPASAICSEVAIFESLEIGEKVEASARVIRNEWDTSRSRCWECGKQDDDVKKCSCCAAARYCCGNASSRVGKKDTRLLVQTSRSYIEDSKQILVELIGL